MCLLCCVTKGHILPLMCQLCCYSSSSSTVETSKAQHGFNAINGHVTHDLVLKWTQHALRGRFQQISNSTFLCGFVSNKESWTLPECILCHCCWCLFTKKWCGMSQWSRMPQVCTQCSRRRIPWCQDLKRIVWTNMHSVTFYRFLELMLDRGT